MASQGVKDGLEVNQSYCMLVTAFAAVVTEFAKSCQTRSLLLMVLQLLLALRGGGPSVSSLVVVVVVVVVVIGEQMYMESVGVVGEVTDMDFARSFINSAA
jgi:hypothetical protein